MIKYLSKAKSAELKGVALLRLDFNTEDEWRMEASLPSIRFLLRAAQAIVIVSHRGRPKEIDKSLSLERDGVLLGKMLGRMVRFIPHFRFEEIKKMVGNSPQSSVFLLENIRFLKGETSSKPELARKLASLADYFVNDAFAVCHRNANSITGVSNFLPSYAGLELEMEIEAFSRLKSKPNHPFVVILGGGKAEDKLAAIEKLENKADYFLLGGVAANTISFLRGEDVGSSRRIENRRILLRFRKISGLNKVISPLDARTEKDVILDIGKFTAEQYERIISDARTILWSGPMGLIEKKKFSGGTLGVAKAIANNNRAFSIVGGGETVMFLKKYGLDKKFDFISTGGGAMLDYLTGDKLPGIEALDN